MNKASARWLNALLYDVKMSYHELRGEVRGFLLPLSFAP
jgi:hypothetical protein